jgi:hypothetical protein
MVRRTTVSKVGVSTCAITASTRAHSVPSSIDSLITSSAAERLIIDRGLLAEWLAWPTVLGEFPPNSPTRSAAEPLVLDVPRSSTQESPHQALVTVLAEVCEHYESDKIAVLLSGGIDSAAIFLNLLELVGPHRVLAVAVDLVDDRGGSSVEVAKRICINADPRVDFMVADPATLPHVGWSEAEPRLDALPRHNDAMLTLAQAQGCQIALTGNGGDELFGTPRFLTGSMAKRGYRNLLSYAADTVLFATEAMVLEPTSLAAQCLPLTLSAHLYSRIASPGDFRRPSPVLSTPSQMRVRDWTLSWNAQVHSILTQFSTWAEFEAWSNVFPLVPPKSYVSEIHLSHPLLDRRVINAALSVQLTERYHAYAHSPYWRAKWGSLQLIPAKYRSVLPIHKQIFGRELRQYHHIRDPRRLKDLQIVKRDADMRGLSASLITRLSAIETWLEIAMSRDPVVI